MKATASAAISPSSSSSFNQQDVLLASLISQLETKDTNTTNKEDEHSQEEVPRPGSSIVGHIAAVRSFMSPPFEPLFHSNSTITSQPLLSSSGPKDGPTVVVKYLGLVGLGMSNGSVFVLMPALPIQSSSSSSSSSSASSSGFSSHKLLEASNTSTTGAGAAAGGGGAVVNDGSVTAIAFGRNAGNLLLVVGHASGTVKVHELKPMNAGNNNNNNSTSSSGGGGKKKKSTASGSGGLGWSCCKRIAGAHASAVTAAVICDHHGGGGGGGGGGGVTAAAATAALGGGSPTWAITSDAQGRVVVHNLSRQLSIAVQAFTSFTRQFIGSVGGGPGYNTGTTTTNSNVGQSYLVQAFQNALGSGKGIGTILKIEVLPTPLPPTHNEPQRGAAVVGGGAAGGGGGGGGGAERAALVFIPDKGHFLLFTATEAVVVCLLSTDGQIQVLHTFSRPPFLTIGTTTTINDGMGEEEEEEEEEERAMVSQSTSSFLSPPYASWRLWRQGGASIGAIIAIAWGNSMTIYNAPLIPLLTSPMKAKPSSSTTTATATVSQATDKQLPAPSVLNSWTHNTTSTSSSSDVVCGLFLFDGWQLLVASSSSSSSSSPSPSPSTTKVDIIPSVHLRNNNIDKQGERLILPESLLSTTLDSPPHSSISGWGEQAIILTSQGIRVVSFLNWQQRMSALLSMSRMEASLLHGVKLFHITTALTTSSSFSSVYGGGGNDGGGRIDWPADTVHVTALPEVARQTLLVLYAYIDNTLASNSSSYTGGDRKAISSEATTDAAAVEKRIAVVADIAINTCQLLNSPSSLYSDIFPRFQAAHIVVGGSGTTITALAPFLRQLGWHLERGTLISPPAEVAQALVEGSVAEGTLAMVEKLVLGLDIMSMDLNQLIPVCLKYELYTALIDIFSRALQDLQTPASLLLVAAYMRDGTTTTATTTTNNKNELGYKLLVFLDCCLRGRPFPPTMSASLPIPGELSQQLRANGAFFLFYSSASSILDRWNIWAAPHHLNERTTGIGAVAAAAKDPYPVLRYLCQLDAASTLSMLCNALKGWDALESDMLLLLPGITTTSTSTSTTTTASGGDRTMTQVAVDALLDLICDDNNNKAEVPLLSSEAKTHAVEFITDYIIAGRASISPTSVLTILTQLAATNTPSNEDAFASLITTTLAIDQSLLSLSLEKKGEVTKGEIQQQKQQQQQESIAISSLLHHALTLAESVGYSRGQAAVYQARGEYSLALSCLTEYTARPEAAFDYIRNVLDTLLVDVANKREEDDNDEKKVVSSSIASSVYAEFEKEVVRQAPQLVMLSPESMASLVVEKLPNKQGEILSSLSRAEEREEEEEKEKEEEGEGSQHHSDKAQFAFLKAIAQHHTLSTTTATTTATTTTTTTSNHASYILQDPSVVNLYIGLLCHYEPHAVLPFLQSHTGYYTIEECLQHCMKYKGKVRQGAAYLLEKMGDIGGALKMYLEYSEEATMELIERINIDTTRDSRDSGLSIEGLVKKCEELKEYKEAQSALRSAISLCLRCTEDIKTTTPPATTTHHHHHHHHHRLWFKVLDVYVNLTRSLKSQYNDANNNKKEYITPSSSLSCVQLEVSQRVMGGLMEELIGEMVTGGSVPLTEIATTVMSTSTGSSNKSSSGGGMVGKSLPPPPPASSSSSSSKDMFGDFKTTLVGLLGACSYELTMLRSASKSIGNDGVDMLSCGYRECSKAKK